MRIFLCELIPLVFFCFANVVTVKISKKGFGFSMPVTMVVTALVLYISQFVFNTFKVVYVLLAAGCALGVILVFLKKKDKEFIGRNLSAGFIAFLAIYLVFAIVDYKRCIIGWDEISHWCKMVKEMLRLDSFYSVAESDVIVHKDYPPLVSIFEMLFCKLMGGYSEAACTLALHIITMTFLIPPLADYAKAGKENVLKNIAISGFLLVSFILVIGSLD